MVRSSAIYNLIFKEMVNIFCFVLRNVLTWLIASWFLMRARARPSRSLRINIVPTRLLHAFHMRPFERSHSINFMHLRSKVAKICIYIKAQMANAQCAQCAYLPFAIAKLLHDKWTVVVNDCAEIDWRFRVYSICDRRLFQMDSA